MHAHTHARTHAHTHTHTHTHTQVLSGRLDVVNLLLASPAIAVNARDCWQRTPMHLAALNGAEGMVVALMNAGAHVQGAPAADGPVSPSCCTHRGMHIHTGMRHSVVDARVLSTMRTHARTHTHTHTHTHAGMHVCRHAHVQGHICHYTIHTRVRIITGTTPIELAIKGNFGSALRHMLQANSKIPGLVLQSSTLASSVHRAAGFRPQETLRPHFGLCLLCHQRLGNSYARNACRSAPIHPSPCTTHTCVRVCLARLPTHASIFLHHAKMPVSITSSPMHTCRTRLCKWEGSRRPLEASDEARSGRKAGI